MTTIGSKRTFPFLKTSEAPDAPEPKRRKVASSDRILASVPPTTPTAVSDPLSPLLLAIQHLHSPTVNAKPPPLSVVINTSPPSSPTVNTDDESPLSSSPTTPTSPLSPLPESPPSIPESSNPRPLEALSTLSPVPTEGRWLCHLCSRHFKTKGILKQHLEIHQGPIECSLCEKHFTTTRGLQEHLRVLHFKCKRCGERLSSKRELEKHEKFVHGVQRRSLTAVHLCWDCGRTFSKRFNLVRHQTNQACRGGDTE